MESYNPCVFIESYCQFRYNSVKKTDCTRSVRGDTLWKKVFLTWTAAALGTAILLTACNTNTGTTAPGSKVKLDPSKPVSLTVRHYYNGAQQAAFDQLVSEFNATEGKDKGIYVEGYTQGSVSDLEKAVSDAVSGAVGAQSLPDIFSTYADTAYAVQKEDKLADLSSYFTEEELSEYVDSYIKEGYFHDDTSLYLFPVAKSTEIMMINKTDWKPFADATGSFFRGTFYFRGSGRRCKALL